MKGSCNRGSRQSIALCNSKKKSKTGCVCKNYSYFSFGYYFLCRGLGAVFLSVLMK